MASELATGYVSIVPSTRGFASKLSTDLRGVGSAVGGQVGDEAGQSFSSKLSAAAGATFRTISKLAVGTGAIVGAIGIAGGTWGLKLAAQGEQATVGFTTMLGSAQAAKDFVGQLRDFAAATPFDFPSLQTASERLIAMGINAQDVIPYMTAIGDAVSGLGGGAEQIDQVVTAIGQMSAKGKIQSDELLQLTEAGIPALKILADEYGVSTSQMQDMVTAGDVLSSDALPKLIDGLENGTASVQGFGGMMAAQSQTLVGLWSTLKDTVGQQLATMMQPAVMSIKGALPEITAGVGSLLDVIGPPIASMFGSLAQFVGPLLTAVAPLGALFAQLASSVASALVPVVTALSPAIATLATALTPLLTNIVNALGPALQAALPPLVELVASIAQGLAPVISTMTPAITTFGKLLGTAFGALGQIIKPLLPILTQIGRVISTALVKTFDALRPVLPQIGKALGQVASVLGGALLTVLKALAPTLPKLAPALASMALSFAQLLVAVSPLIPPLAQLIALLAQINAAVLSAIASATSAFASALVPIISAVAGILAAGLQGFADILGEIVGWIAHLDLSSVVQFFAQIPGAVGGALSALPDIVIGILLSVVNAVTGWVGNLIGLIAGVPGQILNLVGSFLDAGAGLGAAIVNGVKDGINRVAGFAADIAGAILDAFKSGWNTVANQINDFIPNDVGFDTPFGFVGVDLPDNPIPRFAKGGIVPGPVGAPMLAIVHGGEQITREGDVRSGGRGGLFDGAQVYIGDRNVIPDLDYWARTRAAGA